MVITLVRHGQTNLNRSGVMQGMSNEYLNEEGRFQARELRSEIIDKKFDVCYTSPLVRAVETAYLLIGDRVEMIPDKRLIERDVGKYEGRKYTEYDSKKYWDYYTNCGDDGVERIQDVFKRVNDFLDYIYKKHAGGSVLIVSHEAVFRVIRHILNKDDLHHLEKKNINNCDIEEFVIEDK